MNSEVTWVLVSSGTQIQPQIILDPDYLPGYLSVSYDYGDIAIITIKMLIIVVLFIVLANLKQLIY